MEDLGPPLVPFHISPRVLSINRLDGLIRFLRKYDLPLVARP